jgi:hypothetical protein
MKYTSIIILIIYVLFFGMSYNEIQLKALSTGADGLYTLSLIDPSIRNLISTPMDPVVDHVGTVNHVYESVSWTFFWLFLILLCIVYVFIYNDVKSKHKFIWLIALFDVAQKPTEYDLSVYLPLFYKVSVVLLLLLVVVIQFKAVLLTLRTNLFLKALTYILPRRVIMFYCHRVLILRGFFEQDSFILGLYMSAPALLFSISYAFQDTLLGNPMLWASYWFSLGILLLTWDSQAALISYFLEKEPDHVFSKLFITYLNKMPKKSPYVEKSFFLLTGKLTAAGQAALYAGIATCLTGISIASINVAYNNNKDTKDREATQRREEGARQEAQEQRDFKKQRASQKAAEANEQRKHEREHDRERWAHEERMKTSSWSWGRKK